MYAFSCPIERQKRHVLKLGHTSWGWGWRSWGAQAYTLALAYALALLAQV